MDNSKTQQPLNLGRLPINGIILEDNQHRYKLPGEEREGAIRSFANGFMRPFKGLYNGIDNALVMLQILLVPVMMLQKKN